MKPTILLIMCHWSLPLFCQEVIQGPWKLECGASTNSTFKNSTSLNLRYLSPRFKYTTDDWTEEMEKHPEKYKKARFMFELMYMPPLKILCTGVNLQYRLVKYKRLTMEAYGGLKFILIAPPDFIPNRNLRSVANKSGWYINVGLICQLDLGIILPFADIGYDGIVTVGTGFNFHAIYRNPKKRYKLNTQPAYNSR